MHKLQLLNQSVLLCCVEHGSRAVHAVRSRLGPVPRGGDAPRHGQLLRGSHGRLIPRRWAGGQCKLHENSYSRHNKRGCLDT